MAFSKRYKFEQIHSWSISVLFAIKSSFLRKTGTQVCMSNIVHTLIVFLSYFKAICRYLFHNRIGGMIFSMNIPIKSSTTVAKWSCCWTF